MQVIHAQLVLFPEDVSYQGFNVRKLSFFWLVFYRLIEIKELIDHRLIVHMIGYGTEAIILRDCSNEILSIVLP